MSPRRSQKRQKGHAAEIAAARAATERARKDRRNALARQPFIDALTRSAGRAQIEARNQRVVVNHLGEAVAEALAEGPHKT